VRVDLCVSAEVPIFVCLRNSCAHVTEVGGSYVKPITDARSCTDYCNVQVKEVIIIFLSV